MNAKPTTIRTGFTLTELLVVATLIVLAMALVFPSMSTLFTAASPEQAEGMVSGTLGMARGLAIENGKYALVQASVGYKDQCYLMVYLWDGTTFQPAPGCTPQALPGGIAAGQVSTATSVGGGTSSTGGVNHRAFVDTTGFTTNAVDVGSAQFYCFTTVLVLFSPEGRWAPSIPAGANSTLVQLPYSTCTSLFYNTNGGTLNTPPQPFIYTSGVNDGPEVAVWAMTLFNYKTVKNLATNSNSAGAVAMLNSSPSLAINLYSGQVIKAIP
jgi:type II secretory pathway pseudopilin PulG